MPSEAPPGRTDLRTGEVWHRLHGATLALRIAKHARVLILPALLVLLLAREGSREFWLMAMFVPSVLYELLNFLTLRYRFTDEDIIIRQGLLFRNERHIRFRRIHNIDIVQRPLHRLFNVADVKIETASGSEPEAHLRVLSLDAVAAMRQRVFTGGARRTGAVAADTVAAVKQLREPRPTRVRQVVLRIPTVELVRLGLISNRGMVFVALATGLAWEFGLAEWIELEPLFESVTTLSLVVVGLLGVAALIVALLLLRVLSVAWMILRFHGYVLERLGDDLRISCGLLTRSSATIPRRRVQFISVHEPLLARWTGRAMIRLETAGGHSEEEDESAIGRKWFVPILRRDQVGEVLGQIFPDLELENVPWQRLSPRALGRMVRKALVLAFLITLACFLTIPPWGAAAGFVLVPLGVWLAVLSARRIAWARTPGGMVFRSGVLTWKLSATFYDKMQVMSVTASPFDRRCGMASLKVDTAGAGPANHKIDIPYLPREVAFTQLEDLSARAQQAAFRI